MQLELIFPVSKTHGSACATAASISSAAPRTVVPFAFPGWEGGKLLAALAQNTYWFLVLRSDLKARKGDIKAVKGLTIGAAPLVDLGLKRLLVESGIDVVRDNVNIVPVPPAIPRRDQEFRRRRRARAAGAAPSTASGRTAWARRSRCATAPAPS